MRKGEGREGEREREKGRGREGEGEGEGEREGERETKLTALRQLRPHHTANWHACLWVDTPAVADGRVALCRVEVPILAALRKIPSGHGCPIVAVTNPLADWRHFDSCCAHMPTTIRTAQLSIITIGAVFLAGADHVCVY